MIFHLTPLEFAEAAILVSGTIIIVSTAVRMTYRGDWPMALRLPLPPDHDIMAIDLLIGFYAFVAMSSLFHSLLSAWMPAATATQPAADSAAMPPDPSQVLAMTASLVVNGLLFFGLGRYRFRKDLKAWGLQFDSFRTQVACAFVIYIAIWPVCQGLLQATIAILLHFTQYHIIQHDAIRVMQQPDTPRWILVLTILSAAVLAPIGEELFFRGLLLPALSQGLKSSWKAIFLSGLAFGMIHMPLLHTIPALIFFGIALGYIYTKTRSLTLVILIHALFNAKTILWTLLGTDHP